jgi:transcriptional regulator with XRE-family HTH domain
MSEPLKIAGAGPAIRQLRQAAGLSLEDLADRLGWDKGRLSKYETDRLGLSISIIEEIARALGRRPEVVALYCLKQRYPKLSSSEVGCLLDSLVEELGRHE